MVKVISGGQEFYLDGYLKANLDFIKSDIRDDNDAIVVVDGVEGSGKSVLAMTIAKYIDPELSLDNVIFNPGDFKTQVMKAKKYQVIVFDEAISGLRSANWATSVSRSLISLIGQIRQLNLCIAIVIPSIFELHRYIAIHRSRALIHVQRDKKNKRGYFRAYSYDRKRKLYAIGKKYMDHNVVLSDFYGRFTNHYPVDEKKYRAKKATALTAEDDDQETMGTIKYKKCEIRLHSLLWYMKTKQGLPYSEIYKILDKYTKYPMKLSTLREVGRGFQGGVVSESPSPPVIN